MWKRTLSLVLAASLLASPAFAHSRHGGKHKHHRHHRSEWSWNHDHGHSHHRQHRAWRGHRSHHRRDRDEAYLWLGLTVAGVGILALLNSSQRALHQDAWWEATRAPVGSSVEWRNPDATGSVTVLREGRAASGEYCREFQQDVRVGGRSERAWGTACHQEDGSWRITPN